MPQARPYRLHLRRKAGGRRGGENAGLWRGEEAGIAVYGAGGGRGSDRRASWGEVTGFADLMQATEGKGMRIKVVWSLMGMWL